MTQHDMMPHAMPHRPRDAAAGTKEYLYLLIYFRQHAGGVLGTARWRGEGIFREELAWSLAGKHSGQRAQQAAIRAGATDLKCCQVLVAQDDDLLFRWQAHEHAGAADYCAEGAGRRHVCAPGHRKAWSPRRAAAGGR